MCLSYQKKSTEHTEGLSDDVVARRVGEALVLAHMKNFMPILSEKSNDSFTSARWPHQHRSALTPVASVHTSISSA